MVSTVSGSTAVDLGAGFGLHAIPLARRGFSVVAIDSYQPLLQELDERAGTLPIRTVNTDLLGFRAHLNAPAALIVCKATRASSWFAATRRGF